jgi:hypothetical protein
VRKQMSNRWPDKDRISWSEERLRLRLFERAKREANQDFPRDLDAEGVPDILSLEVWLAKKRDKLSWQQIVIKHFPEYARKQHKQAGMSRARRAYMTVERSLQPSAKQSLRLYLDDRVRDLFDCSPEEFKRYLESIRTDKRRK